jgi:hypothetical protein
MKLTKIVLQYAGRCRHCDKKLRPGDKAWFTRRLSDGRNFVYCGSHRLETIQK